MKKKSNSHKVLATTVAAAVAVLGLKATITGQAYPGEKFKGDATIAKIDRILAAQEQMSLKDFLQMIGQVKGVQGIALSEDGCSLIATVNNYGKHFKFFSDYEAVVLIKSDKSLRADLVSALTDSKRFTLDCGGLFFRTA